jgi:NADPH:quinone reductase-like Zn-dependent oxidoreductase
MGRSPYRSLRTSIQAFFFPGRLELKRVPADVPRDAAPWLLVYSGATSVGLFAIQIARLWGYRVITTSFPRNFDLVTSFGADATIDYRDPDVAQKIKAATGDTLAYALDTWSDEDTQRACVRAMGKSGGEVVILLYPKPGVVDLRDDVKLKCALVPRCHYPLR